jgi:1-acyl-sn-glycerol-3-phosphate acyltransferase
LLIVFFRSWIKKIDGIENIDLKRSVIFVANHRNYFDFILLGAIFTKNVVFLVQRKVKRTFFKFLAIFYEVVYIDRDNPGLSFFKKLIKCIEDGKSIIIFPEGTRSRSGKMLLPKIGFVKLAMLTTTPIVPVAIKGTYEILLPHKVLPKFKKCEIVFCKKFYISPDNSEFKDIFLKKG